MEVKCVAKVAILISAGTSVLLLEVARHSQGDNYSKHSCLLTSQNATEICHCLFLLLSLLSLTEEDKNTVGFWVKTLKPILVDTTVT